MAEVFGIEEEEKIKGTPIENPVIKAAQKSAPKTQPPPKDAPVAGVDTSGKDVKSVTTKQRTKTTTVDTIDSPLAITFDSAMDAIQAGLNEYAAKSKELVSSLNRKKEAAEEAEEAVTGSIADQQTIKLQEDTAELKAQLRADEFFEQLGGDEEMAKLAAMTKASRERMFKEQADVRENVAVDFADDPIQWIVNQFTLPGEVEEANVAEAGYDKHVKAISNINALSSNSEKMYNDLAITKSKATAAAATRLIASQATIDAAQFAMKAEDANAEAVVAGLDQTKFELDRAVEGYRLSLLKKSIEDETMERELRFKALERESNFQDTLVAGVVAGRTFTGVDVYTGDDPLKLKEQRDKILTEYELGGEFKATVSRQYEIGVGAARPTPFETARAFTISNPQKLRDADVSDRGLIALQESIDNVYERSQSNNPAERIDLTEETAPDLINKQVQADFATYEANIKTGDEENPNKAAPLRILVGEYRAVKDEPLVVNVLNDFLGEEGADDLDHEKLIGLAQAAVKEGTITMNQAVDGISRIYKAAIDYNNREQARFKRGLPLQKSYNVKIKIPINSLLPVPAFFRSADRIDLSDSVDVQRLIVQMSSGKDRLDFLRDAGATELTEEERREAIEERSRRYRGLK